MVNIAEQAAAADRAEDITEFLRAVLDELHGWDIYLERLQVKVAMTAGPSREQAERVIAELRRYRNTVGAYLRQAASGTGDTWREVRDHIQATRDQLESRAAEVEAALQKGAGCNGRRIIA